MSPAAARTTDHRFYYVLAFGFAAIVFAGFAQTYYLKGLFGDPPLSLLLQVHGAVMTAWFALFGAQVGLIATHRVALHRKLGFAGLFLAALVAGLGVTVSLSLAKRRLIAHPNSTAAPLLLGLQLFGIVVVFSILVSAAVYYRGRPSYHKRLMALAMLSVLGPALTRLPLSVIQNHDVTAAIVLNISCVLLCVGADVVLHRRLHPAFGWGGALVIGSIFVVAPLAQTAFWIGVVRRMLL